VASPHSPGPRVPGGVAWGLSSPEQLGALPGDNRAMNEFDARAVLLVRAVETADTAQTTFTPEDRRHASRAAAELARWHGRGRKDVVPAEDFVVRRAALLCERLAAREPAVDRVLRAVAWRPWLGIVLPLLAFVVGVLVENVTDRQHVNILAFPLLAVIAWNLVVYVLLVVFGLAALGGRRHDPAGVRRWLAGLGRRAYAGVGGTEAAALGAFVNDWTNRSAPLAGARAARVLHLAAAVFALGAVAGLYARGLAFEYRAGWESTFLDAQAVHGLLSLVLSPAARLLGIAFPTAEEVAAIHFAAGAAGENAGRWIHLYGITVALVVVVPRLALAAIAAWRERVNSRSFPVDLDEPYFRRMLVDFTAGPRRLRVVPYSYTLDEPAVAGLRGVTRSLFGEDAELVLRPAVAFGDEAAAGRDLDRGDRAVLLTLALFNLAATPESENHGLVLEHLGAAAGSPLAVLVDEAPYRRRLGALPGGPDRLAERREAWRSLADARRLPIAFVDLDAPDPAAVERDLGAVAARPIAC